MRNLSAKPTLARSRAAAWPGLPPTRKPAPFIRSAEDGVAEGLFGIAASLSDQSSAEVSILYLRMALYLRPDLALANLLLADRFEQLGKFEEAVSIYRDIDKASPYYPMARDPEPRWTDPPRPQGVRDCRPQNAGEGLSSDSENWIALGDAYRDQDNDAAAIAAYDRAEKALGAPQKRDWTLFYARAMAEDRAKQWDKAQADVNIALKLSPDQPELLNYLGYSWVDRNEKIPEALAMLEKARRLRPYDGYIVDSVGWAYYRLGRYDDAARTLEAAVLLVPGDPTINDHLGDALWKAGRPDGRRWWNHALTFATEEADRPRSSRKDQSGLAG